MSLLLLLGNGTQPAGVTVAAVAAGSLAASSAPSLSVGSTVLTPAAGALAGAPPIVIDFTVPAFFARVPWQVWPQPAAASKAVAQPSGPSKAKSSPAGPSRAVTD